MRPLARTHVSSSQEPKIMKSFFAENHDQNIHDCPAGPTIKVERRAPSVERRESSVERRASSAERRASNVERRASSAERRPHRAIMSQRTRRSEPGSRPPVSQLMSSEFTIWPSSCVRIKTTCQSGTLGILIVELIHRMRNAYRSSSQRVGAKLEHRPSDAHRVAT